MQVLSSILALVNVILISSLFYILRVLCKDGNMMLTSFTEGTSCYVVPLLDFLCMCLFCWCVKKKKLDGFISICNPVVSLMLSLFLLAIATQIGLQVLKLK